MRRAVVVACTAILVWLGLGVLRPAAARADDDFFGTSPGALSASHGALDNAQHCADCHINNGKELSNDKCLGCHDHQNLASRIGAGKGFHASPKVRGKKCESCHHEHKSRSYDLMGWSSLQGGEAGFDHELTGWPLKGKHAKTDCKDCHKSADKQGLRRYMGTDRLCGSCHNKDQPHKFERKDMLACERCHTESVWKPAKPEGSRQFNHDDRKDAAMPLLGSHRDVSCSKCHPKSVFNLPFPKADACGNAGCHQSVHDGQLFGTKDCELCHSPTFKTLKQQNFDHTANTRFDLGPTHSKIKCYDCHTKALGTTKPSGACEVAGCHAKDNKHGDRFNEYGSPPRCNVCHPSGGTKFIASVFNHSRTKFPLEAKHAQVSCRACHRGTGPADFENFNGDIACMDCHEHKTVHSDPEHPKGKYKSNQCTQCHKQPGNIKTDPTNNFEFKAAHGGPSSTFPLVKKHKDVACALCHTGRDKKGKTSFSHIDPQCNAGHCHEDSLHKGSLGDDCASCHPSGSWGAERFDHQQKKFQSTGDPGFELKGEHKNNKCESCHPTKQFKDTPRNCSADGCHAKDDAHKGRLGDKCERCHVETGDNTFNHNTMSAFRLDGKHLTVRCADCHPSVTFKPRPTSCFGCHPEPKVHKGQYGITCETCHNTRTWEDIKPLHDVGDFSLKGGHDNIACERCHRDNRPLAGSGNLCINCHRQDDIHNNGLSPRCGECHTQWSFAPARFDHGRVGCNLAGVHRTIACFDCHKGGNFPGIAQTCVSCHHDDAVRAGQTGGVPHPQTGTCSPCHGVNSWLGATKMFNSGIGRESVCR